MTSVMIWRKNRNVSVTYFILLMLFKYIKLFKPDKVYMAVDGSGSWRKIVYPAYKANRKAFRESFPDIDWNIVFENYNKLLQNIQAFTPIYVGRIAHIEGDDTISVLCRYLKDQIVVVSKDHDIKQLLVLPNVSLYLLNAKRKYRCTTCKITFEKRPKDLKCSTCNNKIKTSNIDILLEKDDGDTLESKITAGDKSDNIPKAKSFVETIRNEILVDLFNLPKTIELCIRNHFDSIRKDKDEGTFLKLYPYKFLFKVYDLLKKKKDE